MFHRSGYDALSVADLTEAMGINPPSFYAAFGSKAELYEEALLFYEARGGLDVESSLAPGTPLAVGVARLLRYAADAYAQGDARGCMVIEGARSTVDADAGGRARGRLAASRAFIHDRIAAIDEVQAELATDYVMMQLSGLSGSARNGMSAGQLEMMAAIAARGLSDYLEMAAR